MYKAAPFFTVAESARSQPIQSHDPPVDLASVDPLQVTRELIEAKKMLTRSPSRTDARRVLLASNLLARFIVDARDLAADYLHMKGT